MFASLIDMAWGRRPKDPAPFVVSTNYDLRYKAAMQTALERFEEHLLRGASDCAAVLGLSYSSYAGMKSGRRPIPRYVSYHVEALVALPLDKMHSIVKERLLKRGPR